MDKGKSMQVGLGAGLAVAVAGLILSQRKPAEEKSSSVVAAPPEPVEAAREMWDSFAVDYDKMFRLWSLPALLSMASALQLSSAKSCLEVGCGPGHGLAVLKAELAPGASLTATDLSPEMVKLAKARVSLKGAAEDCEEGSAKGVGGGGGGGGGSPSKRPATPRRKRGAAASTPDSKKETHERVLGDLASVARGEDHQAGQLAKVVEADAQQLPADWSDKFDRVVSCLCLHIVPDPSAALAEMLRVAQRGGLVAFTVWGAAKDSSMFTLYPRALASLRSAGQLPPPSADEAAAASAFRSNFHLGADDAALRGLVSAAGFVDVLSWHVACVWPQQGGGGVDYAKSFTAAQPKCRAALEKYFEPDQRELIVAEMARLADADAAAKGTPVACDVVVVYARKP